jgi:hypothetical protein
MMFMGNLYYLNPDAPSNAATVSWLIPLGGMISTPFAILAVNSISGWLDRTEVRLHELIKSGGHFKEKKTGKGDAE